MPHIDADNTLALAAVMFGLAWFGFWIDSRPISSKVPGVPFVIVSGLILSNLGFIPLEAPAYGFVGQYLLPLGVALLLFKADLRNVFREGGRVLVTFAVASAGICIGAISGFFLFDLGEAGAKVAGTYAGAFIGGVVNFVAISQAVEMTPVEFSSSLSASTPVSILGLLALVSLPSIAALRRYMPSRVIDEASAVDGKGVAEQSPRFRLEHVTAAIAIGLAIAATSSWICARFEITTYNLFVVTVITVILANIAPRQFARLEADFALGMLCMYVFFAMIGAGTDAVSFLKSAPILFLYCGFMIAVHFAVLLAVGKLFALDLADVVIGSAAAIVGPAAGAAIASAKGWKTLVTAAISVGILGYAIANFIGIAIYQWLS